MSLSKDERNYKEDVFGYGYFHGKGSNYPKGGYEYVTSPFRFAQNIIDFILSIKKGSISLLDVGCAYGYLVKIAYENGINAFGVDISKYAIERGGKLNHYIKDRLFVCPAKEIAKRFGTENFDVITALDVIEHLVNPTEELTEFYKALKNTGILILSTPSPKSNSRLYPPDFTHISVKSLDEWKDILKQIGFRVHAPFCFTKPLQNRVRIPERLVKLFDGYFCLSILWRQLYGILGMTKCKGWLPIVMLARKP